MDDSIDVSCIILAILITDLQRDLEHFTAFDMIEHLKKMFDQQARIKRFETVRALYACRIEETENVSNHILKMKSLWINWIYWDLRIN